MNPALLTLVGSVAGLVLTAGIVYLWRVLRRRFLLATAIVGYMVLCCAIYSVVTLIWTYGMMQNNNRTSVDSDICVFFALIIIAAVGFCALVGFVQNLRSSLPWWKLFGCMIAEAGFAISAGMLLSEFLDPIADIIRHGSRNIPQTLEPANQALYLLGAACATFWGMLLLWEFGSPFFRRLTALPAKERRSPAAGASPDVSRL